MPRSMQEVHALGYHADYPRPRCPDCQREEFEKNEPDPNAEPTFDSDGERTDYTVIPVIDTEFVGD